MLNGQLRILKIFRTLFIHSTIPGVFAKRGSENHHLVVTCRHLLEAVYLVPPVRITRVQDTRTAGPPGEITHRPLKPVLK